MTVGLGSGPAPTARVDLPHHGESAEALTGALVPAYRTHGVERVFLIAYSDDLLLASDTLRQVAEAFTGTSEVLATIHVHADTWLDVQTGIGGTVDEETQTRTQTEFIAAGRVAPETSREALAASVAPVDQTPIEEVLSQAVQRNDQAEDLHGWVQSLTAGFAGDQTRLNDLDAARLLLAIADLEIRDAAIAAIDRETAVAHVAMWRDLARRAPEALRTPTAAILALTAWLSGNGALAWVAIDLIENPATYTLAYLVSRMLTDAIHPSAWQTFRTATNIT
ncbi:hypothetical protein GCM10027026_13070 [Myroides odoratimimus subsp. xuanwuensis]